MRADARVAPYVAALVASVALGAGLVWRQPPRVAEPGEAEPGELERNRPEPSQPELGPSSSPEANTGASASAAPMESASAASLPPGSAPPSVASPQAACPPGMVAVSGQHCTFLAHRCAERRGSACIRYDADALCDGPAVRRSLCIDRFEYPNIEGARPAVGVDYDDAVSACEIEGKRLCSALEWALACEGSELAPWPRSLSLDARSCPVDRAGSRPLPGALARASDVRVPSGSHPNCQSPSAAHDLSGSVEEWVDNTYGGAAAPPFAWALAGGHAGKGSDTRCRALDASQARTTRSPTVGFRCCSDAGQPREERVAGPKRARTVRVQVAR